MSRHRVTISSQYYGSVCQNVIYCENPDGALTNAQIATEFYDNFVGHVALKGIQHLSNANVTYFNIKVETLQSVPPIPYSLNINRAGEVQADSGASPQVCLVMQFRSAVAGKHGHGRIYIAGTNPGFWTNGLLGAGGQAYIDQMLPALKDRFQVGGTGPLYLVVHQKNTLGIGDHPVELIQFATRPGIQRRRGIGIGI